MRPDQSEVKTSRNYDSSGRRRGAERRRRAILDVARRRFLAGGFTATTVASVSEEAGVSVDTIYKTFGGKPGLVRAIHDQLLAGDDPVPAEVRSDALQTTESDPRAIMRGFGRLSTEVAPRVAPLIRLIREAAAADPDLADLWKDLGDRRLRRMKDNARRLHAAGHLRPDVTVERAGEVMWIYSSPELFWLLVEDLGWDLDAFGDFVADSLTAALLE